MRPIGLDINHLNKENKVCCYSFLIENLRWIGRNIIRLYSLSRTYVILGAILKGKFEGYRWSQPISLLSLKIFNFGSVLHTLIFCGMSLENQCFHMANSMWHVHRSKDHLDCLYLLLIIKQKMLSWRVQHIEESLKYLMNKKIKLL